MARAIEIQNPKLFKEQDECLIGYIQKISEQLSEDMRDIVVQQLNDVLNAANNEMNFSI